MAIFKHTLIFEGNGHGWSESLYFFNASPSLDIAGAVVAGYADKRAPLLGKECQIKGERLALIIDAGGQKVTRRTQVTKYFKPGTQTEASEDSGTSLQVLMANANRDQKKILFMGGVWRGVFPNGDSYNPAYGNWASLFQQWSAFVLAQRLGWMARTVSGEAVITNYAFDPLTGLTDFTLGNGIVAPSLVKPVRVSVEFPLSRSALDGSQLVLFSSNISCITAKPRPAKPFTVPGAMRVYTYDLVAPGTPNGQGGIGTIVGQNPVSRKRGRPLFVSRGRAPTKVVW